MRILTTFFALLFALHVFADFDVRKYGAKGNGVSIDSPSFNAAIDAAAKKGGGKVVVPAGRYLCYSIRLKSNVTIELETGAVIIAAAPSEKAGYDEVEPNPEPLYQDFGHSHWHNSLIWGEDVVNVQICGQGLIDGSNLGRGLSRKGVNEGNKAIALKNSRNVTLRDFRMLRCGHFALLATGVDNLTIDNLLVDTNRDGFDIDCCKNVRITQCSVNTPWDDAIVIKSSYALGAFHDTENVTVSDCYVSGYDCGTLLDGTRTLTGDLAPDGGGRTGRIKIGTESSGGFRNIAVTNCIFEYCRGLALETVDGGILEDVVVNNITMRHIVNSALFLRLGARQRSPEGTPLGKMRRIMISNINAYDVDSRYSSIISGIPDACIEDVTLDNINIYYQGGIELTDSVIPVSQAPWEKKSYKEPQSARPVTAQANTNSTTRDTKAASSQNGRSQRSRSWQRDTLRVVNPGVPVPEQADSYPEPWMFGIVPAKGIFLRHIRGLKMNNVFFHYLSPDARPELYQDDVEY